MQKSTIAFCALIHVSVGLNLCRASLPKALCLKTTSLSLAHEIETIITDCEDIQVLQRVQRKKKK